MKSFFSGLFLLMALSLTVGGCYEKQSEKAPAPAAVSPSPAESSPTSAPAASSPTSAPAESAPTTAK